VRIWDPATGTCRHTLTGHTDWVETMAIAPDGGWLATAGSDGTVRIWDPATGTCRHTLTGHTDRVETMAIAPDGRRLATAGYDGTLRIWDPAAGTACAAMRVDSPLTACEWFTDSIGIFAGGAGGKLYGFDLIR
jgi:WD40 repeat protein